MLMARAPSDANHANDWHRLCPITRKLAVASFTDCCAAVHVHRISPERKRNCAYPRLRGPAIAQRRPQATNCALAGRHFDAVNGRTDRDIAIGEVLPFLIGASPGHQLRTGGDALGCNNVAALAIRVTQRVQCARYGSVVFKRSTLATMPSFRCA